MEQTNILQIGTRFNAIRPIDFFSNDFLGDADILIVNMSELVQEFMDNYDINSKNSSVDDEQIEDYQNVFISRKKELREYYAGGGNVFLILDDDGLLNITTAPSEQYPDGDILINFFTLFLENASSFSLKRNNGRNIIPADDYKVFMKSFNAEYGYVFQKHSGTAIFNIKNNKGIVGVSVPVDQGRVILLPKISFKDIFQPISHVFSELDNNLKAFNKKNIYENPSWCDEYLIGDEAKEKKKLEKLINQQLLIQEKVQIQQQTLENYSYLKRLISTSGNILEDVVEKVLSDFGYGIIKPEGNRDDLIIIHNNEIAVVEIKGVKGSSGETHAAQLVKWVSNYYHDHQVEPKGILIVNTFHNLPVTERIDADFPNQMLKYCTRQELCLITGKDLLDLYIRFISKELDAESIHRSLFSTIGVYKMI